MQITGMSRNQPFVAEDAAATDVADLARKTITFQNELCKINVPLEDNPPPIQPGPPPVVVDEPVADEPVAEEPVADEPVAEEPVADEPVAEEPVADVPVAEEPVADEPVAEEPVADEPVAEEPVADEPVAEEPIWNQPAVEEPVIDVPIDNGEVTPIETVPVPIPDDTKVMALVTGVEYDQWGSQCSGAEHDAYTWADLLTNADTEVLVNEQATTYNILDGIHEAAQELDAGDQFFLTFASHGSGIQDMNGDEADGQDEVMHVYDGQLVDDDLWDALSEFKPGVQVIVASDTCHSGTNADIEKAGAGNADFIQISGATDDTLSYGGPNGGTFTNAVAEVAQGGNYTNMNDFFDQVYQVANSESGQTPQMTYAGPTVDNFVNSDPFAAATSGAMNTPFMA